MTYAKIGQNFSYIARPTKIEQQGPTKFRRERSVSTRWLEGCGRIWPHAVKVSSFRLNQQFGFPRDGVA
jgi:hypothetical protein